MTDARLTLADGAVLAYGDAGARPPLVLVHGWPLDRGIWAPQLGAFAGERRVLAPDLVGAGDSSPVGRATIAAHADDLLAWLDRLEIHQAALVGLSMGGYVALDFAHRYPERLAALVLADTRAEADTSDQRDGRIRMAEQVAQAGVAALLPLLLPRLLSPTASADARASLSAIILRQPAAGVIAGLHAMAERPDASPWLSAIAVPTLVLVGAADAVTPPEAAAALAQGIPGARRVVIPGAGHLANLEEPGAVNAALRAFLQPRPTGEPA
jgi:pimeloyl-ACP methyl ester carboxylesterase